MKYYPQMTLSGDTWFLTPKGDLTTFRQWAVSFDTQKEADDFLAERTFNPAAVTHVETYE